MLFSHMLKCHNQACFGNQMITKDMPICLKVEFEGMNDQ